MPRRCLILEVRADTACLAIATDVDIDTSPPSILADVAGRERQPLASPWLWDAGDDGLSLDDRARLVAAALDHREYDEAEVLHRVITSLFTGIRRFAESRIEREVAELFVVIPGVRPDGMDLADVVRTCGSRAGFKFSRTVRRPVAAMIAYGVAEKYDEPSVISRSLVVDVEPDRVSAHVIEIEEGIVEMQGSYTALMYSEDVQEALDAAVDVVLTTTRTERNQIQDVVVLGSHDDDDVRGVVVESLEDRFPGAIVHSSLPLNTVSMRGVMALKHAHLKPADPATFTCCLMFLVMMTVSVETSDGLVTPICCRNFALPTLQTAHVRVYAPSNGEHVALRFYEGERPSASENIEIGTLIVRNLVAGWNDVTVRVDIDRDEVINISATLRETTTSTLRLASSSRGMTSEEYQTIMSAQLAEVEADRALRRPVQSRQCTENLVILASTLIDRAPPAELCRPLEVLPLTLYVEEADLDADLRECVSARLAAVNDWSALSSADEQSLHDDLLDLLGERVQRYRQVGDTCSYCTQHNVV